MPDTGQAAGQEVEVAVRFTRFGRPLSYADAATWEAAGWALTYRAAQEDQVPSYTLQPHTDATLAADGWHLLVAVLVNGQGPVVFKKPGGVRSYFDANPPAFQLAAEGVDLDDVYNAIQTAVGVATGTDQLVVLDFQVTEGDSLVKQFTIFETAVTLWGYVVEDLDNGTLTLTAAVRLPDNRVGDPDAWVEITVVSATTGADPVLRMSWTDFPAGLEFDSVDPTDDADVQPVACNTDVQFTGSKTYSITAVSQGSKTFTLSGDRRRWFSRGGQFVVTGSTGNNGTYTVTAIAYSGGNTVLTVTEALLSAIADGLAGVTITQTVAKGKLTIYPQVTR
jgi:hypothetical protein